MDPDVAANIADATGDHHGMTKKTWGDGKNLKGKSFTHDLQVEFRLKNSQGTSKQQQPIFDISTATKSLTKIILAIDNTKITDNEGKKLIDTIEDFPETEDDLLQIFDYGNQRNNKSVYIYFSVTTSLTFQEFKKNNDLWKYVNQHGIFINRKGFAKVHEKVQIGTIILKHPTVTHRPTYDKKLMELGQDYLYRHGSNAFSEIQFNQELDDPNKNSKLPPFETTKRKITWEHVKTDGTIKKQSADILYVSTTTDNAEWLKAVLIKATNEDQSKCYEYGSFVPLSWRYHQKKAFTNLMNAHKTWLKTTYVMPICGVSTEVMHGRRTGIGQSSQIPTVYESITSRSGAVPGKPHIKMVYSVDQTEFTHENRKHFITCHNENREMVYKMMDEYLPKWCQETDEFLEYKFARFPIPRRMRQDRFSKIMTKSDRLAQDIMNGINMDDDENLKPTNQTRRFNRSPQMYIDTDNLKEKEKMTPSNPWLNPRDWKPLKTTTQTNENTTASKSTVSKSEYDKLKKEIKEKELQLEKTIEKRMDHKLHSIWQSGAILWWLWMLWKKVFRRV